MGVSDDNLVHASEGEGLIGNGLVSEIVWVLWRGL